MSRLEDYRAHRIDPVQAVKNVTKRGCPRFRWIVDRSSRIARHETWFVTYYETSGLAGSFEVNGYELRRGDLSIRDLESEEDCDHIDDACYSIHQALSSSGS